MYVYKKDKSFPLASLLCNTFSVKESLNLAKTVIMHILRSYFFCNSDKN